MNKTIFRMILAIGKRYRLAITAFLVIGISQTFAGLFSMVLFQRLLDSLPSAHELDDLIWPMLAYLGLTATNHLLIYFEGYPRSILNNGPFLWVKLRALQKITSIDYLAYQDLGTGNLVQLIENGADATRNILNGFYLEIARSILPQLIISLFLIHYYDPTLFTIIIVGYGFLYLIAYYLMAFWRREVEKMLESQENFSKFSVRAFMELVVFRINGRFKTEYERIKGISDEIVRTRGKVYLLQELFYTGFAFLVFFVQAGVVVHQVGLILAGTSTLGTLVALVSFIGGVFGPITSFSMAYINYKMNVVTFARLQRFLDLPDDTGLSHPNDVRLTHGDIELQAISFSYPNHEVLRNFSLTLQGGKTTGLVGASGSGKSTLLRLLLCLLKPTSGRILIDGKDLTQVNLESYYRKVAYIPQEPPVFDGSLRENLAFDHQVPPARMDETIRSVGLDALVRSLPLGLETMIGERGIKLSGGERQRLAFGRLLLQNPKIIVLDEPTSSLDSLAEDFVTRNLQQFLREKTVIIVTHRLQTVVSADEIIMLEDGQIIQRGTFDVLVSSPGKFRQLWEKQAREEIMSKN